jgi:predicted transcriptional regulator
MPTLTIRNLPTKTIRALKALAEHHNRSMEQEVRQLIEVYVGDRLSAISQIERGWGAQARSPSADEIDSWIRAGRP